MLQSIFDVAERNVSQSSNDQCRYQVTLNAPTTTRKDGNIRTSHLDEGKTYFIAIVDIGATQEKPYHTCYRTRIRTAFDCGQEPAHEYRWPSERQNGDLTVEYVENPTGSLAELHDSSAAAFTVIWKSNTETGGSYCLIPVRFLFPSDSIYTSEESFRLFADTESLPTQDFVSLSLGSYEEHSAFMTLFKGNDAGKKYSEDISRVEKTIADLEGLIQELKSQVFFENGCYCIKFGADTEWRDGEELIGKGKKPPEGGKPDNAAKKRDLQYLQQQLTARQFDLSSIRPVHVFERRIKLGRCHSAPDHPIDSSISDLSEPIIAGIRPSREGHSTQAHPSLSVNSAVPMKSEKKPVACFHVRPEHLSASSNRAIYLRERTMEALVHAVCAAFNTNAATVHGFTYLNESSCEVSLDQDHILVLPDGQNMIAHFGPPTHKSELGPTLSSLPNVSSGLNPATSSGFLFHEEQQDDDDELCGDSESANPETFNNLREHQWAPLPPQELEVADSSFMFHTLWESSIDGSSDAPLLRSIHAAKLQSPASYNNVNAFPFKIKPEDDLVDGSLTFINQNITDAEFDGLLQPRTVAKTKPRKKRQTKGNVSSDQAGAPEVDRHAADLERNRLAAAKCRLAKLQQTNDLREESREKATKNKALKETVLAMEMQLQEMTELWASHADGGCVEGFPGGAS